MTRIHRKPLSKSSQACLFVVLAPFVLHHVGSRRPGLYLLKGPSRGAAGDSTLLSSRGSGCPAPCHSNGPNKDVPGGDDFTLSVFPLKRRKLFVMTGDGHTGPGTIVTSAYSCVVPTVQGSFALGGPSPLRPRRCAGVSRVRTPKVTHKLYVCTGDKVD